MRLNLGAGRDIREGFVNVDIRPMRGTDVICNLDHHPWPYADGAFELVVAQDILEHLEDVVGAMDECHRLLRPGGHLHIKGPEAGGRNVWADVTHRRAFTLDSFDHFDPATPFGRRFGYGTGKWRILHRWSDEEDCSVNFILEPRKEA